MVRTAWLWTAIFFLMVDGRRWWLALMSLMSVDWWIAFSLRTECHVAKTPVANHANLVPAWALCIWGIVSGGWKVDVLRCYMPRQCRASNIPDINRTSQVTNHAESLRKFIKRFIEKIYCIQFSDSFFCIFCIFHQFRSHHRSLPSVIGGLSFA